MQFPYLHHLIDAAGASVPAAFTYPFRYTPHPLCELAAQQVQVRLRELKPAEGKMYGVLVVRHADNLAFLAAYSGQQQGSYDDDWFVPPVFDYLQPDSYFMCEQAAIVTLNQQIASWHRRPQRVSLEEQRRQLLSQRDAAVVNAQADYKATKGQRTVAESQYLKANIRRAKHLYADTLAAISDSLTEDNTALQALQAERKQRSETLQQWLFSQFVFLNARGEHACLTDLFPSGQIPSGTGECCAPKLLQAAYNLGLQPLCMAEFWWDAEGTPSSDRISGRYYPACNRKCRPILDFMLQGLNVEADPAQHYDQCSTNIGQSSMVCSAQGDASHLKNGQCPEVVWEDEWYAAVNKPAGWLSVQGLAQLPCVEDWAIEHFSILNGQSSMVRSAQGDASHLKNVQCSLVHRLDQDTSGILLIAKTAEAHRRLQHLFERRQVKKRYIAILEQHPSQPSGIISLPLAPDIDNRPRQLVSHQYGLEAITRYEVIHHLSSTARVAFYPETGRTHQLRVHAASPQGLNSPILGDRLYGHIADRLYLHAESITFTHPFTRHPFTITCPCPF